MCLPSTYVLPIPCPPPPHTVYRIRNNFSYLAPAYIPISPLQYNLIWSHCFSQLCPMSYLMDTAKVFLYSRMPFHSCY